MSSIPFLYNDIETHAPGNYSSYSVQPFFDSSIASVEKKNVLSLSISQHRVFNKAYNKGKSGINALTFAKVTMKLVYSKLWEIYSKTAQQ